MLRWFAHIAPAMIEKMHDGHGENPVMLCGAPPPVPLYLGGTLKYEQHSANSAIHPLKV